MRVAHVTYQHPADDARILHKQCRSLVEAGIETHLIAPLPAPPDTFGVSFHALSRRDNRNKLGQLRTWFSEIHDHIAAIQPDLVQLHDPMLLFAARRIRRRFPKLKLIYDAHEDHPRQIRALSHLSFARRHAQAALFARLESRAPRVIDQLIAATPTIAQRYPADRTTTVRNLPRLSEYTVGDPASSNAFIYLGGLTRSRGVIEMVDAMTLLDSDTARLILAGRFDSAETERAARARPGWSRVEHLGWIEHAHVPDLLRQARAGLVVLHPMPNYLSAWPVKLFEYMAAGLPFIASDFPQWREMLGEASCGLYVKPKDPRTIADAMSALLRNPDDASAMGAAGRQLVERQFNWECEVRKLTDAYERLVC